MNNCLIIGNLRKVCYKKCISVMKILYLIFSIYLTKIESLANEEWYILRS